MVELATDGIQFKFFCQLRLDSDIMITATMTVRELPEHPSPRPLANHKGPAAGRAVVPRDRR